MRYNILRLFILTSALTFFALDIRAQQIQASVMSGPKKSDFNTLLIQPLDKNGNFTFTQLAFIQRYHDPADQPFDEVGVQANLFWNLSDAIGIGPGIYYNSAKGLMHRAVFQVFQKVGSLTLVANPTLYYHEDGYWGGEFFGQLSFINPVSEDWSVYAKTNVLTTWDRFEDHGRSFIQLRVGPRHSSSIQFGLAYDRDWYSPFKFTRRSLGLFIERWF